MASVTINGEALEVRSLSDAAPLPEALRNALDRLAEMTRAADAAVDLAALALGRPRAWVANNLTSAEVGEVVAAMVGGERG